MVVKYVIEIYKLKIDEANIKIQKFCVFLHIWLDPAVKSMGSWQLSCGLMLYMGYWQWYKCNIIRHIIKHTPCTSIIFSYVALNFSSWCHYLADRAYSAKRMTYSLFISYQNLSLFINVCSLIYHLCQKVTIGVNKYIATHTLFMK